VAGRTTRNKSSYFWLPGGLAAVLALAVGYFVSLSGDGPAEVAIYDRILRGMHRPPDSDIVIVDVDSDTVARLGEWPLARDIQANLLYKLRDAHVREVVYAVPVGDSSVAQETARMNTTISLLEAAGAGQSVQAQSLRQLLATPDADFDAPLARAMKAHGNVVLGVYAELGGPAGGQPDGVYIKDVSADDLSREAAMQPTMLQAPAPRLVSAAALLGHLALLPDSDHVVRRDVTAARVGDNLLPSLSIAVAARSLSPPAAIRYDAAHAVVAGGRPIALEEDLAIRPHFYNADQIASFAHFSYVDVLNDKVAREALQDRIVIIGSLAQPGVETPTHARLSMTMYVAQTSSSVMQRQLYVQPWWANLARSAIGVAIVLFAAFGLPAIGLMAGSITSILLAAIMIVVEVVLVGSAGMWLRLLVPAFATLIGLNGYALAELIRRARPARFDTKSSATNLGVVGETFRKQGQLDLAFETLRRAPADARTLDILYLLGLDFEKRRQFRKAAGVYEYILEKNAAYRDVRARRSRMGYEPAENSVAAAPAVTAAPAQRREPPMPSGPRGDIAPAGRTLGRYRIERELGKGAMGTVFVGLDPHINRTVAIKAIPLAEEFAEEDLAEARARFFREAEMAGRLNHPNIVTVYDAGEDQGLAYIAMEYLRGQHLSHHVEASRLLPAKTVILLVARVAEALHYAHRQNVVHRDIKPANIMFNQDADELKITDFGIARLTDTSRTKTGIVLGTPSFMSPEQLEGRNLDGRSDLFALGVSLYQLLTGQLPFRADSMPRLMQKIVTEPHSPLLALRPELPPCVEEIVGRALAKSEQNRYQTGSEMAAALRACAENIRGNS
jgi:eukaryotic-like serine/threonine-protein kinase